MFALTAKQRELLTFIKAYQAEHGYCPAFHEMREALSLASKSGVHRLLTALEERGYIRRLKNRTRAIEVVEEAHLPPTPLADYSLTTLAAEARLRGYRMGFYAEHQGEQFFHELA